MTSFPRKPKQASQSLFSFLARPGQGGKPKRTGGFQPTSSFPSMPAKWCKEWWRSTGISAKAQKLRVSVRSSLCLFVLAARLLLVCPPGDSTTRTRTFETGQGWGGRIPGCEGRFAARSKGLLAKIREIR